MSFVLLGILNSQAAGAAPVGGAAYDLLETTVLTSTTSSVSFTGLGSYTDYKHLQLRIVARSDRASFNDDPIKMFFNADTGANYAWHRLLGDGSTVTSSAATSISSIQIISVPAATSATDSFGASVIDILDFSDSSKNTTSRALTGMTDGTYINLSSGLYNNTSAVTSIRLETTTANNYVAGSRFSLYGIRAA